MELILLIEPDTREAFALRRALRERTGAEVVVAASKDAALAVMDRQVPDLVLFHALISPDDEQRVLSHLRKLPSAAHLQTLTIPLLGCPSDAERPQRGLFAGLRSRKRPSIRLTCEPRTFADEVAEYLARARAMRQEVEAAKLAEAAFDMGIVPGAVEPEHPITQDDTRALVTLQEEEGEAVGDSAADADASEASAADRRGTRRWRPAEVPWVRSVQIAREQAELLNISSGGVLIRTGLRPEVHPLEPYDLNAGSPLDLIFNLTSGRDVFAPGRIVRCHVATVGRGPLRYDVAFRFDAAVGLDLPDETVALAEILDEPLTVRTERLSRLLARESLPLSARETLSELTAIDTALGEIQVALREARRRSTAPTELRDLTSRLGPRIRQLQASRAEIVERLSLGLVAAPAA